MRRLSAARHALVKFSLDHSSKDWHIQQLKVFNGKATTKKKRVTRSWRIKKNHLTLKQKERVVAGEGPSEMRQDTEQDRITVVEEEQGRPLWSGWWVLTRTRCDSVAGVLGCRGQPATPPATHWNRDTRKNAKTKAKPKTKCSPRHRNARECEKI